jgi:hypothetical protein
LTKFCRHWSGLFTRRGAGRSTRDERLDALALAVLEQAAEVDERPVGLAGQGEVGPEGLGVVLEPQEDAGREGGRESSVHPRS